MSRESADPLCVYSAIQQVELLLVFSNAQPPCLPLAALRLSMVLVRAWVKAELEGILQVGATSPPVTARRGTRVRQKQHVQCVEVDETCRALKINDGETMVWCFVTKRGMHKVNE